MKKYDCICIGAGPAGYAAAIRLAQSGKKTAIIDYTRAAAGGVCLNQGCIPVKSIVKSSQAYRHFIERKQILGIDTDIPRPSYPSIAAESRRASETLKKGLFYLFKKYKLDFYEGEARLKTKTTVSIKGPAISGETLELEADNIILATGSDINELPSLKIDGKLVISSREALKLDKTPDRMLIVGAGAIGVEFATIFNNLGSEVTLIEIEEQILPQEDKESARALEGLLKKEGIRIKTGCRFDSLSVKDEQVSAVVISKGDKEEFVVDKVLSAVGRRPNIDAGNLSDIGIKLDKTAIAVNELMRTSVDNIYAVGDVNGLSMFAHAAYRQAEVAVSAICGQKPAAFNKELIPRVVYCNYEFAAIGPAEESIKEAGTDYVCSKYSLRANGRAIVNHEADGIIKLAAEKKTGRLLALNIISHEASELLHLGVLSVNAGLAASAIESCVFAHPTVAEAFKEAAELIAGKPLHA